jgi:molybdate transport system regulatory protein
MVPTSRRPFKRLGRAYVSTEVKTKLWLEREGRFVIGDGGLRLLDGIARCGSLAEAVREIGWSYRHAWGYLRRAESQLGAPLISARPGRGAARGMTLTATGQLLVERLRALRACIDGAIGPTGPTPADVAARGRLLAAAQQRRRPRRD